MKLLWSMFLVSLTIAENACAFPGLEQASPNGVAITPTPNIAAKMDLNSDGIVDEADLLLWMNLRYSPTPSPTITRTPTRTKTPTRTRTPTPPAALADIELLAISRYRVATDPTGFFSEPASGNQTVGINEAVYLAAIPKNATSPRLAWSVLAAPPGSQAGFATPEAETVMFRPELEGSYKIALQTWTAADQPTQLVTVDLTASYYVGTGTVAVDSTDALPPSCGTAFCHGAQASPDLSKLSPWSMTRHARVLQAHLSGQREREYSVECLPCHTTGFRSFSTGNHGFSDTASTLAYDLHQISPLVQLAYDTHTDQFPQLPKELQSLASVQCEVCHGAGSQHNGNPLAISIPWGSGVCLQCHDAGRPGSTIFYQGEPLLAHRRATFVKGESPFGSAECARCHTAEGFSDHVKGVAASSFELAHGVSCAACHDPHRQNGPEPLPSMLRVISDPQLGGGTVFSQAGKGALCMNCHQARIADITTAISSDSSAPHLSPQADMLQGANAYDFGAPYGSNSYHGVQKVYSSSVSGITGTCVACHMAASMGPSGERPLVGGHTFMIKNDRGTVDPADDVENVAGACHSCHSGLTTINRPARGDYNGDGNTAGIQSEVEGLLQILSHAILTQISGTSLQARGDIAWSSASFVAASTEQKAAVYNYNFVHNDGSRGIHNTAYAIQILQRTYKYVTGHDFATDFPLATIRRDGVEK